MTSKDIHSKICIVYQKQIGGRFQTCIKKGLSPASIFLLTYIGIFSIHRVTTGSWDQAFTKIITDANPGSDYDRVYRNNFVKDFSINSENSFKSMMEKLMNNHHVTAFTNVPDMTNTQLYQSCEVSIGISIPYRRI